MEDISLNVPKFFDGYDLRKQEPKKVPSKKIVCKKSNSLKRNIKFDTSKFTPNGIKNLIIVKFFLETFPILNVSDIMIKFFMAKKRTTFLESISLMNSFPHTFVKSNSLEWISNLQSTSLYESPLEKFKKLSFDKKVL